MNRSSVYFVPFLSLFLLSSCWWPLGSQESFDLKKVAGDPSVVPVVVIGGGCAGLTAGLYAAQANIPCLVIQGPKVGGALSQSHSVRNWPGFKDTPGANIVGKIKEQARDAGATISTGTVTNIDLSVWPRTIELTRAEDGVKQTIKALTVIIALGAEPNLLGVSGESGYWGKGVSNCAVCDGSLFTDKKVAVVGGGDSAIEEAGYLSSIANTVYVIVRKDALRAKDKNAVQQVLNKKNVQVLYNTHITKMLGDGNKLTNLELFNSSKNEKQMMSVDGLFLAIGSKPNTTLLRKQIECDSEGFIACKNRQETSVPGVYAAGDVCDPEFVQGITAAGDGCKAALQAIAFLKHIGFEGVSRAEENTKKPTVPLTIMQEPKTVTMDAITSLDGFKEKVLSATKPVYLDIISPMCISCQQMMTVLESLEEQYKNKITFVKLNITERSFDVPATLLKLGGGAIQSVPTGLVIVNGKEVSRFVGVCASSEIKTALDKTLKK